MSSRRRYNKGKHESGSFSVWPHVCARSDSFKGLSPKAKGLLLSLLGQYNGRNNGDLCCAWGIMKHEGWRSRDTLERARDELERSGWILRTRQGGRNMPNLYALTFYEIDECDGKLDGHVPIGRKPGDWKNGAESIQAPGRKAA